MKTTPFHLIAVICPRLFTPLTEASPTPKTLTILGDDSVAPQARSSGFLHAALQLRCWFREPHLWQSGSTCGWLPGERSGDQVFGGHFSGEMLYVQGIASYEPIRFG